MAEEPLDEIEIDFTSENFPFHNMIKLGSEDQVKNSIGQKMWEQDSNSQTLSEFLSAVTETSVKDYLCSNVDIGIENVSQKSEGQTLKFEGCEISTSQSQDQAWILHHFLKDS